MRYLKNKKGTSLSIVLVTFLIIISSLSSFLLLYTQQIKNYENLKLMMKQKNLEILLTKYYIDSEKNGILFSDEFENEEVQIRYDVDILSDEEVTTEVVFKKYKINYKWILCFDMNDFHITRCEYL